MRKWYLAVIMCVLVLINQSCEKEVSETVSMSLNEVDSINTRFVILSGELINNNRTNISEYGICYDTYSYTTIADPHIAIGSTFIPRNIKQTLNNLIPGTSYYVRGYYQVEGVTYYSNEITFTTDFTYQPIIRTLTVTDITKNSAIIGFYLDITGIPEVNNRGVCYDTTPSPTLLDFYISETQESGLIYSSIENLEEAKTYYVRAFATNAGGTFYGEELEFMTNSIP